MREGRKAESQDNPVILDSGGQTSLASLPEVGTYIKRRCSYTQTETYMKIQTIRTSLSEL